MTPQDTKQTSPLQKQWRPQMDKVIELAKQAGFRTKGAVIRTIHSNGSWVSVNGEVEKFYTLARADLEAENAKLRDANRDCTDWFEQLKVDFDKAQAANAKLRDALEQQGEQQGEPETWIDDGGWEFPIEKPAAPAAQPCCKEKMELENFLQELSKQSGWASTVIRKHLNEMSSKEK